jgi:hypothetical protein
MLVQLDKIPIKVIEQLMSRLSQTNHLDMNHAIFFYKLHPERLFKDKLHPEKLISVKTRLMQLYNLIETFHMGLATTLVQKGYAEPQDFLFHGDVLPKGIDIKVDLACRKSIVSAIKLWALPIVGIDDQSCIHQLQEIFRAYKYWFNPSRLIDVIMNLQEKPMKQNPGMLPSDALGKHMLNVFKSLSTSECLDLYGYFSNKDTNYLMKTLLLAQREQEISWLPKLDSSKKRALRRVYEALSCVMNVLCILLNERNIETQPYEHYLEDDKQLTPGRRNRQAVIRVIELYQHDDSQYNDKIDDLFKKLES